MEGDGYFAWRNIDPASYKNFQLPAYLCQVLDNPESRILDFGCGFGQVLSALRRSGFSRLEGADVDPSAIAHLRDNGFVIHNLREEPEFYDRHSGGYDYVLMSHVIEHFPKEQIIPQLSRIRRLLNGSGGLIVMVPNAQSNTGCYWAYEDFTHHTLFTAGSLYYVLRASGFSKVEFLDPDCTAGQSILKRFARKFLLALYRYNLTFWNKVTGSAFHGPSPRIFSYEIKALARD
jgi:SAM-dependent methyltransferase